MIKPQGTLKIGPSGYKLNPTKLTSAPYSILPYLLGACYYTEEFEYFDIVKPYLDIPEKPKTLDEIQQEFDEKIDKLIENTKNKFYQSKYIAEKLYNTKFDRIIQDFEYAKENGNFPPRSPFISAIGFNSAYPSSYTQTSFVIKQGDKHEGYYTFGNQRFLKYYMPDKPNRLVRFFMKTCLGFVWVDE